MVGGVCRWAGGGLQSKDTINSQLGDGVNQLVVGDIGQELHVVQKVGPKNGVLDVCNEKDPPKGAPEPEERVWDLALNVVMLELLTACRE